MKLKKILSCVLVFALAVSMLSVAAAAYDGDIAETGAYYNQNYLETYASAAYNETGLGCTYTKEATTFKVWAPEADSVMVRFYSTGTDAESGAATLSTTAMTENKTTGVWSLTVTGDQKNKYYTYLVTRNGVVSETQDPYAKAVGANGDRSMVCDLDATDPDGWDQDQHVLFDSPGEAVVWEVHVRDFSILASSGVSEENRGKYLAFTEGNTTVNGAGAISTCVDYLVEHNVNCVQLMPIEDFASVDETSGDPDQRNWGYDPKNYNVPEGSYASDAYDGNTRITEFKMLVQALHDRGISVVMDVVYNHTFVLEGSPLSRTTPKYYYRMKSDSDYYDGTGLGNVLASEKKMVQKFISESLQYWVNEYHIDGFRFDLMGCHDVDSMKVWRSALDKIDTRILMYGEPWYGGSENGIANGCTAGNISSLTRVGAFNQGYSSALKGDEDNFTKGGFVTGGDATEILNAARGVTTYLSGAKVNQMVNYIDNHDNLTLFDKILSVNGSISAAKDDYTLTLYNKNKTAVNNPSATVLSQMKLALTSALTSQGTPFMVAGTEFCRTKYGDANSYRTPDVSNAIDWTRAQTYSQVADYYAGLAAIRKAVSAFGDATSDSITTISGTTAYQITNNKSGQWNKVIVAMNNTSSAKNISLSGSWVVVANGTKAGTTSLGNASGSYSVPAYSGVVLVDASSFANYTQPATGTATLTVEHYTRDSSSGSYTKVKTETAKYKDGQTYRASKNLSILFDHNFDKFESTSNVTYGTAKSGQNITVKFYYTRYITSGYLKVNFIDTSSGSAVKYQMKYHMRNGDAFSVPAPFIQGYQLDTTKYPAGTKGTFDASNPAEFTFYYKALTVTSTRVHYYKPSSWRYVNAYAYYGDPIQEPLGAWEGDPAVQRMKSETIDGDSNWVYIDIPVAACYVMFHYSSYQVPGAGEQGYNVSGEAWVKNGVVSFNNTIVTSHIDLETGKQVSADVTRNYTTVSTSQIYSTSAVTTLGRNYITPANASGFFQAGVTNVVYLYTDEKPVDEKGDLIGDADLSEKVEITDATYVQRHLANLTTLGERSLAAVAPCNNDDKVTVVDVTYIQRYLASLPTDGSRVGERLGEASDDEGEHTFGELVEIYNELSTAFGKYSSSKYGTNEYYIAAQNAVNTYKALVMSGSGTADEIDEAYEACEAALKGLDNIEIVSDGSITLYFSNSKGWESVYAYMWGDGGANGDWPGVYANYVKDNEYYQGIFSVDVDLSIYNNIIFTDGSSQTVDIPVYSGMQNGLYATDDQDEEGKYYYGSYNYDDGGDTPIYDGGYVYLDPGIWNIDGARFSAYFFEGDSNTWVSMKMTSDGTNYSAAVPSGYSNVVFVRFSSDSTENTWDNYDTYVWNQTEDLSVMSGSVYHISAWGEGTKVCSGYWG